MLRAIVGAVGVVVVLVVVVVGCGWCCRRAKSVHI